MKRICDKCDRQFSAKYLRYTTCPDCRRRCRECGGVLNVKNQSGICASCRKLDDTGHEQAALRRLAERQRRELLLTEPPAFRCRSLAETVACATPANAQHRESCMTGGCAARCHSTAGVPSYE